jgi:copper chaperone
MYGMEATLKVQGMTCGHCERAVAELAAEVDGVRSAAASAAGSTLQVTFEGGDEVIDSIVQNINSTNIYKASKS